MIQVTASGGGPTYDVCRVSNLKEGTGVVKALEAIHLHWLTVLKSERARNAYPLYIQHFEGCDVYAQGQTVLFTYTDEWEEVSAI